MGWRDPRASAIMPSLCATAAGVMAPDHIARTLVQPPLAASNTRLNIAAQQQILCSVNESALASLMGFPLTMTDPIAGIPQSKNILDGHLNPPRWRYGADRLPKRGRFQDTNRHAKVITVQKIEQLEP